MKSLRSLLDRLHPQFTGQGKYKRFYPLYEALDTFLYTPGETTVGASHVRDGMDLKRMMSTVIVALIPVTLMAIYNTGYQANLALAAIGADATQEGWRGAIIEGLGLGYSPESFAGNFIHGLLFFLPVYIVTFAVGGTCEVIFGIVRKHDINEGFLVTGWLFPLTLPPTIPLWQVATGIAFGVVLGKEVFGGTGKNFLNPALTARAFLYFAYPGAMTGDTIWTAIDGYSAATPLGELAVANVQQGMEAVGVTWSQAFWGWIPGSMGETSVFCCLLGAALLIATGIGSWRIMLATVLGGFFTALAFHEIGSDSNAMFAMPPHWHMVVGGFVFGTVFMCTDPVSAAMTETGKWFYGLLIGALTILIRVVNPGYPEGIMLAILFGNVFAPLIDYSVIQANIRRRLIRNAA